MADLAIYGLEVNQKINLFDGPVLFCLFFGITKEKL